MAMTVYRAHAITAEVSARAAGGWSLGVRIVSLTSERVVASLQIAATDTVFARSALANAAGLTLGKLWIETALQAATGTP
jgi:hypothetical protein